MQVAAPYIQTFVRSSGWGPRGYASTSLEAFALGMVAGISGTLACFVGSIRPFLVFCTILATFHMSEFLFAAVYHPSTCSTESFLIPHSRAFSMAMSFAVVEYFIEWLVWSSQPGAFFWIGLFMCSAGQVLRWVAFINAGHNFTHLVQEQKDPRHVLVTDGIYRYIRHPGYCGWFWWSVGTQLLLCNPVATVAFAYASWKFFAERIPYEEELLESKDFFGPAYTAYKRRTPTYIPFIE